MKNLILTSVLLAYSLLVLGQTNEFTLYANGLIYDTTTMNKLGVIVDSLNLKFKTCDLSKPYYSYSQGIGYVVKISNKNQLNFIKEQPSLDEFNSRFPLKGNKKEI